MGSEPNENVKAEPGERPAADSHTLDLIVTLDLAGGRFVFDWIRPVDNKVFFKAELVPGLFEFRRFATLRLVNNEGGTDYCNSHSSSVRAFIKRIRNRIPVNSVKIGLVSDQPLGIAQPDKWLPIRLPAGMDAWTWLTRQIREVALMLTADVDMGENQEARGKTALYLQACTLLEVEPSRNITKKIKAHSKLLDLRVTFEQIHFFTELVWTDPKTRGVVARGKVRAPSSHQLTWDLNVEGKHETGISTTNRNAIRAALGEWLKRYPSNQQTFSACWIREDPITGQPTQIEETPFEGDDSPVRFLEDTLMEMAEASDLDHMAGIEPFEQDLARHQRRLLKQRKAEEERQRRLAAAMQEQERRKKEREAKRQLARSTGPEKASSRETAQGKPSSSPVTAAPLPPLPVHVQLPDLTFQENLFPLHDLQGYLLRERAALWWVSNQSDDLLCLPNCRIQRLDYQIRTALRVLGPLRGRALLSDEVGLGKTIEAGLVIKELLTRGMVKRFLVLTVPSLVDQWEEELNDKFGLETGTTNQNAIKNDPQRFWKETTGIVASLHTLKQPAHLEIARQVPWDILIVDEAHYLRNRESQAWQAVNVLPRQFLLLLTATPVQNSLEELYNLVTLLQPGQLPTPKEFRARFMDPKRPRQPREPEELRRLLSQIMIRNTRANSGVQLPPRRAETVLFTPEENERAAWQQWESELRASLAQLNASQASLWGRLLLQAAGSSPQAWRSALNSFPDKAASRAWREAGGQDASWRKKCELVVPLARGEGGVVIFTQFLETQTALAEFLKGARISAFVINGSTPAPERQPITEQFRREGGALLLTHSGTEGRNLQFCHRLVNFDLPWNPMEIEQRIGRLHRLGQQHPVRIFNFVQAGTLQEHLLEILQEKLNLFELVVGEAGLILGDRFSSDEFAEEILHRWRESEGRVAEAFATLGQELAAARDGYKEVKQLDETLFAKDYESL